MSKVWRGKEGDFFANTAAIIGATLSSAPGSAVSIDLSPKIPPGAPKTIRLHVQDAAGELGDDAMAEPAAVVEAPAAEPAVEGEFGRAGYSGPFNLSSDWLEKPKPSPKLNLSSTYTAAFWAILVMTFIAFIAVPAMAWAWPKPMPAQQHAVEIMDFVLKAGFGVLVGLVGGKAL